METEHLPSILIVDDNEVLREQLVRGFARRGYNAQGAEGYDAAVALAKEDSPEFAVVDLKMPGKSGLEVLQTLRELDPTTRVVILTGYGSIGTAVEATKLGASFFVQKPADIDDLLAAFARGDGPPMKAPEVEYTAPTLARAEWEHINRVLEDCGNNVSEAARRLGIHRRSLQRKLQKYPPRH